MHVLVLLGGPSAEREISLRSGQNVANALRSRQHTVTCLDPVDFDLATEELPPCEVVFIALHGTFGEDGEVQAILESRQIPYTGSGPSASATAFHKLQAKTAFLQSQVRTPDFISFAVSDDLAEIETKVAPLGYPLFVKPEAQGSSIGVSYVTCPEELSTAIQQVAQYGPLGLIEQAIAGTEWTLACFDQLVLPLIFIQPQHQFYDYSAKYEDPTTRFDLQPSIPVPYQQELIVQGQRAYQAVQSQGVARVDMILDTAGQAWVLEVNTIPGLTEKSLVPKAALKYGWSYAELCEEMCLAALRRSSSV